MSGIADLVMASAESLFIEDLRKRAGDSWDIGWSFYDAVNDPVDFSAGTATWIVTDARTGAELFTWTDPATAGHQIALGTDGTVRIIATPEATEAVGGTTTIQAKYILRFESAEGDLTLGYGGFMIFPKDNT